MKTADLQQYFLWEGQITQVLSINPGKKSIGFKIKKTIKCPHCKQDHDIDLWMDVIESSPLFQEGAKQIESIIDTNNPK